MLVPRSPPRAAKKAARLRLPVPRPDTSYDSSCLLCPTEAALTGLLGWGAGRSRKPPWTLKLRPSPRIRGDAAEARLRVSEASCASRCLLSPTLAPTQRSVPGRCRSTWCRCLARCLRRRGGRPARALPPHNKAPAVPASGLSFMRVPTPPRLAPVGGSARVTSLGLGTGDPHGHPPGCQVEPNPRWGVSGSIGWGVSRTWNPTWARVAHGVSPLLPHTHIHTQRHR